MKMLTSTFLTLLLGAISAFAYPEVSQKTGLDSNQPLLQILFTSCPRGTTTCGPDKCCVFPNANCCEDGQHCCPEGYRCDLQQQQCVKISDRNSVMSMLAGRGMVPVAGRGMVPIAGRGLVPVAAQQYITATKKTCPGGSTECPVSTSCCLNDDGAWSCCPKAAKAISARKEGYYYSCCLTFLGYACCDIPFLPLCTFFGCI